MMMGNFEEMLDQIDPHDATLVREFQDFLRVVKLNRDLRKKLADADAEIASLKTRLVDVEPAS
jgi:hypothetical protein